MPARPSEAIDPACATLARVLRAQAQYAHDKSAIGVESQRHSRFADAFLPVADDTRHCREHGVRRCILVVERHRQTRFGVLDSLQIIEGACRVEPGIPVQGERIAVVARREIRIECDGLAEEALRGPIVLGSVFVEVPQSALVGLPGIEPIRRLAHRALPLGLGQRRLDRRGDAGGYLVLHGEDVAAGPIVALGPEMSAGNRVDQLRRHANVVGILADRPFEHVADAKFAGDLTPPTPPCPCR